jgi:hypothetical protein
MAYTIPTAANLKAKYPAFAAVADATVDLYLADAARDRVDTSWIEGDYAPAIMAAAAHEMALLGMAAQSETAGHLAAGVASLKSGNFQVSFSAEATKRASRGGLDATPYGEAYKRLLKRNKNGPRVVARADYAGSPPSDGYLP